MTWLWWAVWFPLVIVSFALIEGYAFKHPGRQWTLSTLGARWPLSIALVSGVFFTLLTHFYWHFCPPGLVQGG